jgi:hypothetical protein
MLTNQQRVNKMKYIIKLNGKTISKRKWGGQTCTLKISHNDRLGIWKKVECFHTKQTPMFYIHKNDNPDVIFYDWSLYKKDGNNYVANFTYSVNQQKIDIIKQRQINND